MVVRLGGLVFAAHGESALGRARVVGILDGTADGGGGDNRADRVICEGVVVVAGEGGFATSAAGLGQGLGSGEGEEEGEEEGGEDEACRDRG